jgi:phage tail tape-measure protein
MSDEKNDKEKAAAIIELFKSLHPIVKSILVGGLLGSIVPVIGTIIGAIIGGVAGFWWFKNKGDEDNED